MGHTVFISYVKVIHVCHKTFKAKFDPVTELSHPCGMIQSACWNIFIIPTYKIILFCSFTHQISFTSCLYLLLMRISTLSNKILLRNFISKNHLHINHAFRQKLCNPIRNCFKVIPIWYCCFCRYITIKKQLPLVCTNWL